MALSCVLMNRVQLIDLVAAVVPFTAARLARLDGLQVAGRDERPSGGGAGAGGAGAGWSFVNLTMRVAINWQGDSENKSRDSETEMERGRERERCHLISRRLHDF